MKTKRSQKPSLLLEDREEEVLPHSEEVDQLVVLVVDFKLGTLTILMEGGAPASEDLVSTAMKQGTRLKTVQNWARTRKMKLQWLFPKKTGSMKAIWPC